MSYIWCIYLLLTYLRRRWPGTTLRTGSEQCVRVSGLMSSGGQHGAGGVVGFGFMSSPGMKKKEEEVKPPGYWDSSSEEEDEE